MHASKSRLIGRMCEVLLVTSAIILSVTAVFKVSAAIGNARVLSEPDPLLGVSTRFVMLASAVLEAVITALLLRCKSWTVCGFAVSSLAAQFVLYHVVKRMTGLSGSCPCLGAVWAWTGQGDHAANNVSMLLALYLLIAGSVMIVCGPISNRKQSAIAE